MKPIIIVTMVLLAGYASAQQQAAPTDPVYWCSISRSQVSQERDAALAKIELLSINNDALGKAVGTLQARIRELEAASKKEKE